MYSDDDMLMLSGIQHFRFCPRQWALIHIEQQWDDNHLTVEGKIMHKRADDPFYRQKCGDYISLRSVSIASHELGFYGITDVVELHPAEDDKNVITHPHYPGLWTPYPVEYKHGRPKRNEVDEIQLATQAMCLEELYGIRIGYGALFYGETQHRIEISITEELRDIVRSCAKQMHDIFRIGKIPEITAGKYCGKCSLKNICMPETVNCTRVSHYLNKNLYEETT
jgi:CRISPR-associated exonuclease Cas4